MEEPDKETIRLADDVSWVPLLDKIIRRQWDKWEAAEERGDTRAAETHMTLAQYATMRRNALKPFK